MDFAKNIISIQVLNGSQARLSCSVMNLGQHEVSPKSCLSSRGNVSSESNEAIDSQVSWIHVDRQLLLSTQTSVRTRNPRVRIARENDTFVLVIDQATLDDVGYYACRVSPAIIRCSL